MNNHTLPHLAQQNHEETLFTQTLFVYYLHLSRVKQIPMCCEMSYVSIVYIYCDYRNLHEEETQLVQITMGRKGTYRRVRMFSFAFQ